MCLVMNAVFLTEDAVIWKFWANFDNEVTILSITNADNLLCQGNKEALCVKNNETGLQPHPCKSSGLVLYCRLCCRCRLMRPKIWFLLLFLQLKQSNLTFNLKHLTNSKDKCINCTSFLVFICKQQHAWRTH